MTGKLMNDTNNATSSIGRSLVSRLSLLREDTPDDVLIRLGDLERAAGFRTGQRFSLEGRTIYEVQVDLESGEFFISEENGQPVRLTKEQFDKTSGLCYWQR
jgi:hypothetical protein